MTDGQFHSETPLKKVIKWLKHQEVLFLFSRIA
jgi:hypothetical protein